MDLYSLARRVGRPWRFDAPDPRGTLPIEARGAIGDGFTAALVRVDGVLDWLCLPAFDSPSVFAALLDGSAGGLCAVTPAGGPFEALQRYDDDTNVLETLLRTDTGVARLVDFMPWTDDPRAAIHEVHRRIECVEGRVDLQVLFDPRFDYGRAPATLEAHPDGILARGPAGERLAAVLGGTAAWAEDPAGGVRTELSLGAGERRFLVLSWGSPRPAPVDAYRPWEHLRLTRRHWREWTARLSYEGPWRHHVVRSALALKLMVYAPTGAMVAAPTTSLPEWLGGQRNWDYRYAWIRDTAMSIRAANRVGCRREARDFFHFVRDAVDDARGLRVMYTLRGEDTPEEEILSHLAGYAGSGPVRIGNGAKEQLQLDTAGALVDAAALYETSGGRLGMRAWRVIEAVTDEIRRRWREPDNGIWEPRSGVRHNVHSKLMCWLALERGAELAGRFSAASARTFADEAARVRADLLANGLSARGDHFVSVYGGEEADATLLLLSNLGFLPPDDPRIERTVEWVRAELGDGPLLHRYRAVDADGVGGEEGAFVLCGFWLAEALARAGRVDEAEEVFVAHAQAGNHVGLLAEELEPASGRQLGNFPQAFSHVGLINAAVALDRCLSVKPSLQPRPAGLG